MKWPGFWVLITIWKSWKSITASRKTPQAGTAMHLARVLADAVGRDIEEVGVYERKGMIERKNQFGNRHTDLAGG